MKKIERNILYIDAANLIKSAQSFDFKLNIFEYLSVLKYKYSLTECYYFTAEFLENRNDYNLLESLGVKIIYKKIYSQNSKIKANCDVEITKKIVLDLERDLVDNVFLLSGDGDFYSLLKFCESKNKKVKIIAPHPKTTSYIYKNNFNLTYFIDIIGNISPKRKELIELSVSMSRLFVDLNISNTQNLSNDKNQDVLKWNLYTIVSQTENLNGVMLRGRLRKLGLENNFNILTENTEDLQNGVRFAILDKKHFLMVNNYLQEKFQDIKITLEKESLLNPVLSKIKCNDESRCEL